VQEDGSGEICTPIWSPEIFFCETSTELGVNCGTPYLWLAHKLSSDYELPFEPDVAPDVHHMPVHTERSSVLGIASLEQQEEHFRADKHAN
jgi:hypothetical protein